MPGVGNRLFTRNGPRAESVRFLSLPPLPSPSSPLPFPNDNVVVESVRTTVACLATPTVYPVFSSFQLNRFPCSLSDHSFCSRWRRLQLRLQSSFVLLLPCWSSSSLSLDLPSPFPCVTPPIAYPFQRVGSRRVEGRRGSAQVARLLFFFFSKLQ